jgi:N-formylglutamate amidohydrolase
LERKTDIEKLPLVLSIPHCGRQVPVALRRTMALTDAQIDASVDIGTWEIFGTLPVLSVVASEHNRLVTDLNRAPDNRGDRGIVSHCDYHGRVVYREGFYPDAGQIDNRIDLYHRPFHARLTRALKAPGVFGLLDCHSLNGIAPLQAPDNGRLRRQVVLSNNGDADGNDLSPENRATSDTPTLLSGVAAFEAQGFSVSVNHPYRGGYIITEYGRMLRRRGRFAIQIEINQMLFIPPGGASPDPVRLRAVKTRVLAALTRWTQAIRASTG